MLAQCPQCQTLNTVPDDAPPAGDALVACQHCGNRFSAARPDAPPPRYRVDLSAEERLAQIAPPPAGGWLATALWLAALAALLALLAGQYAYFYRNDLARHSAVRPYLEPLCRYAGCTLPLQRDAARIAIVGRDIRRHPAVADALLITVTLDNTAPFQQPFPDLQLSFFDVSERLVARRRFTGPEYLPPTVDPTRGFAPGDLIQTTLEIVDPGPAAVNFEFEFF